MEPEQSQAKPPPRNLPGLHVLAKPAGALCNLACKYCFYLEKKDLYDGKQSPRMSEEVLEQLDDFLVRRLGRFILAGKSMPVAACELISRMRESSDLQKNLCKIFKPALEAFQRQSWSEAIAGFNESMKMHPEDGPTRFYLDWCETYKRNPPGETWDGVVRLQIK